MLLLVISCLTWIRIRIQDAMHCLSKNPSDEDVKQIEHLQDSLCSQFAMLEQLQQDVLDLLRPSVALQDNEIHSQFDDLDEEEITQEPAPGHGPDLLPLSLEHRSPCMPLTCSDSNPVHCTIELILCRQQACQHLTSLRETIADKSFQYSHVLHAAPGKLIQNCARSSIRKLNDLICFHCWAYTKCRLALVWLAAGEQILSRFPILSKHDVKASTALLTPNIPGSSTICLSWIWQTHGSPDEQTPHALRECA